LARDDITFGDINSLGRKSQFRVENVTFGQTDRVTEDSIVNSRFDGVFGLSFEGNIKKNTTSPLEELYRQKKIPSRSFSIKIEKLRKNTIATSQDEELFKDIGKLVLGGYLEEWVRKPHKINYHPIYKGQNLNRDIFTVDNGYKNKAVK